MMAFTAPEIWRALCISAAQADPFAIFAMWLLMSVAMMAPSFVPALSTYRELAAVKASNFLGMVALLAGYLVIWFGFSAAATLLQVVLADRGLLATDGASLSTALTVSLLTIAGLYQFSRFKDACLAKCRAPLTFFMEHWREGPVAAIGMGAQLGVFCLGCCWALMLLGFVGGTMNILWMGLATLFMIFEKLPQFGAFLTRPAGFILLGAALLQFVTYWL